MTTLLSYFKSSLKLELKKTIIYPFSFWIIAIIWPLYSVIQVIFLETIYSQTNNFVGYSKYEAYVLFGTFTMVQTLGHLFCYRRLAEFAYLVKGYSSESLDLALIKPIDAQIFVTTGRFNLGNIVPALVGLIIVFYGLSHETQTLSLINILTYIAVIPLGIFMYFIIFSVISFFLIWFPELQVTESLWGSLQEFGQYPSSLYQGGVGVIMNIILPITLMASIPVDLLFGKLSIYMVFTYYFIVAILLLLTRLFWKYSIRQYSSSSS